MSAHKLSAVIISKNEADRIAQCLSSLKGLTDDIIVVDSGSTDGTVELAESYGAKVFDLEWKGYGPTKNWGNERAQHDWIISLDADEWLSEDLKKEILNTELVNGNVYMMDRQNIYLGKEINHSGWSPDWVLRIFNRKDVLWNDNLVHEKLIVPSGTKKIKLKNKLMHNSYRSREDHMEKIEKYARLKAESWINKKNHPGSLKRLIGPFAKAFSSYVLKLGFLDGSAGWQIALTNAHLVRRQIHHFDSLKKSES